MPPKIITQVYIDCFSRLIDIPEWRDEIHHVRKTLGRPISEITPDVFFQQYAYVVLCSYWKEQYARKEWEKYFQTGDFNAISNRRKRAAIAQGLDHAAEWLEQLKKSKEPVEFLDTLPMIGEITKKHLARNLGIDCAKPDRHLIRLAAQSGYGSSNKVSEQTKAVDRMCLDIHNEIGGSEKIGVIDVVLWRACNLGWI